MYSNLNLPQGLTYTQGPGMSDDDDDDDDDVDVNEGSEET